MSRTLILLVALLALLPSQGLAQAPDPPKWDIGASVGLFSSDPDTIESPYGDDWFVEGRYAVSIGRFWTTHLETEVEFAATSEGSRYTHRYATVPGVPSNYPYSVEEHFRLNQVSGRVVWQFFENTWVHPYVLGGVSFDSERRRTRIAEQYDYASSDPRVPGSRITIGPAENRGAETVHRVGAIAGLGTKVYFSPNTYFNTAFIATHVRPSRTASFIAGFGCDF